MMTDAGPSKPLVRSAFDDTTGVISPDGLLLAYQSDESGRWEIYLQRLDSGRRVGGSAGSGRSPFWSADGRTLFYTSADALVRRAISASGEPVGAASRVAPADGTRVGADGSGRVLFYRPGGAIAARAVVALQWVRELRGILGSSSATSSPR